MLAMADLQAVPPSQVLDRISTGERTCCVRVTGTLNVAPLATSCWLCGEDMRGVHQTIALRDSILDELSLEGCTFYKMVRLNGCRIAAAHFARAYFYSALLIENCAFEGPFEGQHIQKEGGVVIHNTVFSGWADFGGASLRGQLDLVGISFPGGTNLLYILTDNLPNIKSGSVAADSAPPIFPPDWMSINQASRHLSRAIRVARKANGGNSSSPKKPTLSTSSPGFSSPPTIRARYTMTILAAPAGSGPITACKPVTLTSSPVSS
jgi:hypothetical protein